MSTDHDHRREFVRRLTDACDRSSLVPPPNAGRQVFIAQRLSVSNESVNKWFKGTSMPRPQKMKELAKLLGVDEAWLALGITPELDRQKRLNHGRNSDGAAQLVFGMMTFAGIKCGTPSDTDPRSEYVDFYAMIGTSVYPIRVTLGREVSEGVFEFFIIPEYRDVRMIAVIPLGQDKFHFLELDKEHVDALKTEKAPSYRITAERDSSGTKYRTGDHTWTRIRLFSDLG